MTEKKKRVIRVLTLACTVVALVILFLPWVTLPLLDGDAGDGDFSADYTEEAAILDDESSPLSGGAAQSGATGPSASSFGIYGLLSRGGKALPEPKTVGELSSAAAAVTVVAVAAVACLIAYASLLLLKRKHATKVGLIGFLGLCALSFMFMDLVYNANSASAYSGPGLFTTFLYITPLAYLSLFWGVLCSVVILPAAARASSLISEPRPVRRRLSYSGKVLRHAWLRETLSCVARDRHLYLMLLPFLAYYVIFYYLPYRGLQIAFLNYKPLLGYAGSAWVGLDNFIKFFTGPYFWRILRNTLYLNVYSLLFGFPIPIILAILFSELRHKKFRTAAQTVSYVPYFVSTVVIAGMAINFLSPSAGIVNIITGWFGAEPVYFISKTAYFRTIYVVLGIWQGAGFGSIIYYSSICSIDADLYEAATIDGAGRFRQIRSIMLPSLLPTISIMLIMEIGNLLNASVEMVLLLYKPVVYEVADIIGTYVYRIGMAKGTDYSTATTVGLFNGIVALILVLSANKISKHVSETSIF